ncbi:MAG TPA: tripartite tricarboxylate transporter substrate binding protein [Burkholderiales bacterium]|nr:tripartite tricarboxylate transporter substrate binding protein [Burkholderiales bacterium]
MQPLVRLLAFLGMFLAAGMASAQGYPSKPVRMLVPFPPGGSTDMVARMITPKLGELLGQQIFVDYKGGAGGSIGAAQAARSAPDGYTILMVTDTHAMNHHVYKVPYDFFKSLDPISLLVQAPGILVAHPSFAPSTVKELIDYAKANPEKVTYGSAGVGNASHMSGFLFSRMTGVRMTHVPYKGGGPLITDLLGGHVNLAFGTLPLYAQLVKSGKLKLIAVLSKTRIPQFPDTPTAAETVPGFEYKTWYGLLAPAGTPKEILARLNQEVVRALADATVKEQFVSRGFDVTASSPEAFAAFLKHESDIAGRLVRDLDIKPE